MIHTIDNLLMGLRNAAAFKAEIAKSEARLWRDLSRLLDEQVKRAVVPSAAREQTSSTLRKYLNISQAMEYLGISRTALYQCRLKGLRFVKVGRSARYDIDDLDALAQNFVRTSD
jgi:predicted DNA-binding transcriptional regulator AlpA